MIGNSGDGSTEDTAQLEFDPPLELDLAPEQERRLREFADAEGMAFPEEVLDVALEVYMRDQGVAETIEVIDDDPELQHAAVEERDPVAQLEIIRRSRVANVYDRERVQELADGHGFAELVAEIGERGRVGYEDLVAEVDDWRGDRS
jgi:hypothetical protein